MKKIVPIRIHRMTEYGYNMFKIEILQQRYASDFFPSLEPIGLIQFQQTIGEDYWYGMQFQCSTSYNTNVIDNFNKIVKHINKFCTYDSQPIDIMRSLNMVEHKLYNSENVSVLDSGKFLFNVNYVNHNNSVLESSGVYAKILATTKAEAEKKLAKIVKQKNEFMNYTLSIGESNLIDLPIDENQYQII